MHDSYCLYSLINIVNENNYKKVWQEIQHTNKKKHIIQLFTKRHKKNKNIMPDLDRCKVSV